MRILWFITRQHIGEAFGVSVIYLSSFFINFYRAMGLLTAAEQKRFPLQTETANEDDTLNGNEVDSKEDDTKLVLPLANVDKSEDKVEEWRKKKRKLHRVAISETTDHRAGIRVWSPVATKLRLANVCACSKMKSRQRPSEKEGSTECSTIAF